MVITDRKAKKWVRGMPLVLVYSCISIHVDRWRRMGVYVWAMGKSYKKIYLDDSLYTAFKAAVRPLRVNQALQVYMDIVVRSEGSMLQSYLERMIEEKLKPER